MNYWNIFGLNPNFKEFLENHPDKTLIGVGWSIHWRLAVVALTIEMVILLFVFAVTLAF